MVDINSPWEGEYRPKKLENVLGSETLLDKFKGFVKEKSIPNLLFVGEPGTGKTTTAKILASDICGDGEYLYISASDRNDVNTMRTDVKEYCYTYGMDGIKIVVLDEADFLTSQAQGMLRNTTEEFQQHCRFIMTANYENKIIKPLQSRFQKFVFEEANIQDIYKRCGKILKDKKVKITDQVKKDLKKLVKCFYPDIRSTINNLQKFTIGDVFEFDPKFLKSESNVEFINYLKEGDIKSIRENCLSGIKDYTHFYRCLYDSVGELTKVPSKIGQIILIIAEYQYKHAMVVDPEINFVACLVEIRVILADDD